MTTELSLHYFRFWGGLLEVSFRESVGSAVKTASSE